MVLRTRAKNLERAAQSRLYFFATRAVWINSGTQSYSGLLFIRGIQNSVPDFYYELLRWQSREGANSIRGDDASHGTWCVPIRKLLKLSTIIGRLRLQFSSCSTMMNLAPEATCSTALASRLMPSGTVPASDDELWGTNGKFC